jgi:SnoaL-like polyketide cyclase
MSTAYVKKSSDEQVELYKCTPQSVIEYYFYYGWNKNDENAMKEIVDENVKFRGGLARIDGTVQKYRGRDGLIQYMHDAHTAITNKRCQIRDIIVDSSASSSNQRAAVKVKVYGTFQQGNTSFFGVNASSTNQEVSLELFYYASTFFTFNEACNKIIEIWVLADIDCLKNQLHATAESTFHSS